MYASREKQVALTAAVNLLCEYIEGKLPDNWDVVLMMNSGGSSLELRNPEGNEVHVDNESSVSRIDSMCVMAIETDRESEEAQ